MTLPSPAFKTNLLGLDRSALQFLLTHLGEKPFRANQLMQWIHQKYVSDFSSMHTLSRVLRDTLEQKACLELPGIIWEKVSQDGTHKWLLRLSDGNSVEMVFIPEPKRGTLCISSQVGCALNCSFCSTGKQGFSRNLSTAEIVGQLQVASRRLNRYLTSSPIQDQQTVWQTALTQRCLIEKQSSVTNVVFMGMGEPLLNFDSVVSAMDIMMDDLAYGLSKYRVTLSTSGVIPAMLQLKARSPAALAVSLHAPYDALRNELVPLNKKYPLKELMPVCRNYFEGHSKRVVTFEYVMLKDVNDSLKDADLLSKLLKEVPCKLNLIPFNPFPLTDYTCSSLETILAFQKIMQNSGIHTTIRKTRGDDIDAACGQLVGKFQDRTRRNEKWLSNRSEI